MSRHTCREEGANAQDDGEQGENDRNAIAVRYIVNADSECLAYPSAGYREDCAYTTICAFIVRLTAGKARLRTISGHDLQANPGIAVQQQKVELL